MEQLWTPWRMAYVGEHAHTDECVFCSLPAAGNDVDKLILERREHAFLMMNLFPYNTGHLLVVPYQHVADLDQLPLETATEIMEMTQRAIGAIRSALSNHGFNLGMNLGEIAGAGIAAHLHMHLVPRWSGDANFMPIVAGTKVLPELLPTTYAKIRAELCRPKFADNAVRIICFDRAGDMVLLDATRSSLPLAPITSRNPQPVWQQTGRFLQEAGSAIDVIGWAGDDRASEQEQLGLAMTCIPAPGPIPGLRWTRLSEAASVVSASDAESIDTTWSRFFFGDPPGI